MEVSVNMTLKFEMSCAPGVYVGVREVTSLNVPSPELLHVPVVAPPLIVPDNDTVAFGTKQTC